MVAITLRPGGAPSTPREHHDEALKSEARGAPFGVAAAVTPAVGGGEMVMLMVSVPIYKTREEAFR
jgi:hypothetical protein